MKSSLLCPKCQSRQLWVIDGVAQSYECGSGPVMRVHSMSYTTPTGGTRVIEAGKFEAWVCAGCGFTEWYAKHANKGLAELAAQPGNGVRWIDTTGQRGPYR